MKRQFRIRRRVRAREEMREEVAAHVSLAAEALIRRGVEPDEAWKCARDRFGDFESAMDTLYKSADKRESIMQRREYWEAFRQDLTVSLRQMRRSPMLAIAIVVTLALGIGANLVMFGIANRLLFSAPTGVAGADALRLLDLPQGGPAPRSTYSNYATMMDLSKTESFSSLGGFAEGMSVSLGRGPRAEPVTMGGASASFFTTVGARPVAGRFFLADDDLPPRGQPVAIISHEFWDRKFGRDPSAIGATLSVDERTYTIIGVTQPHFTGLELKPVDMWIPMTDFSQRITPDFLTDRGSKWMKIVARLAPAASEERAVAEGSRLFGIGQATMRRPGTVPGPEEITTLALRSITPGRNGDVEAAKVSVWLVGVAVIVLLIACANVATLLLTRAMRRAAEIAVRLALGVSRRRLVAQLVAESALFAVIGAGAALYAAYLSRGIIQSVLLPDTELGPALPVAVVAIAIAVVVVICVLTSLAPALQVLNVDLVHSLRGASGQSSQGRSRLRSTLLVAQVAMSAVLLVGAGLFLRSLDKAKETRLGIDMDRVSLAEVAVYAGGYDFARQKQYWADAVRKVRAVPGVENAALTIGIPLRFSLGGSFIVPGIEKLPKLETGGPYRNGIDERFFATLGARIVSGRGINDTDGETTTPVVVINETLAKGMRSAGVTEPLGLCVKLFRADTIPCATIVGVVEDISRHGVTEKPSMQYYMPKGQWRGQYSLAMVIRAQEGHNDRITAPVTRALQATAGDIPYPRVNTFEQLHAPRLKSWRLGATMFTLFGALAFIVAVVGLYGLLAYNVAARQYEFGVRTALGAQSGDIVRIVLRSGLTLVTAGLVIGLATAAAAAKFVGPLLYNVEPRDMMVYAGSAVLMLVVTALVAAIPAKRASSVSPTVALRGEN